MSIKELVDEVQGVVEGLRSDLEQINAGLAEMDEELRPFVPFFIISGAIENKGRIKAYEYIISRLRGLMEEGIE